MSVAPPRVVLDTVVFLQALISGRGSSAACIERLSRGQFHLFLSEDLLTEMREVPLRPELTRKYSQLTPERVSTFLQDVQSRAVFVKPSPCPFKLTRDPDDQPLIDLAVAVDADFLVTWNARHLTYLMKRDTPEGIDFCGRYPRLQIGSPPELLAKLDLPKA